MAKSIQWTSSSIDDLMDQVNKGYSPSGHKNPFFESGKNGTSIRKAHLAFSMSSDEIKEYVLCAKDVCYFAENYCKIKNEDSEVTPVQLRPYQHNVLNMLKDNRFNILLQSRQTGKCVTGNTIIEVKSPKGKVYKLPIIDFFYKFKKKSILDRIRIFLYFLIRKLSD